MVALELLEKVADPRFTTELGKFNLEMNLDPLTFGGSCLSRLETQLSQMLDHLREVARELDVEIVLTGILPTLRKSDLGLENMTPVTEDESLDLVASLMEWKRIRHIPVEDVDHRLVGLISYRSLLKLMSRGLLNKPGTQHAVSEVMNRTPVTVLPGSSTLEAIELMRQHEVSCLPVVSGEHLVGIITERDLMNVAATLLEQQLKA